MKNDFHIRKMKVTDIEGVLAVEHEAFTMPWTAQAFLQEITKNPFSCYKVAEQNGKIIAYSGQWIVMHEAHLTNIAVLSSHRGIGVGRALLQSMIVTAFSYGVRKMVLEVRKSNLQAQRLYEQYGFRKTEISKGYYTDNNEDAWIMVKRFVGDEDYR